MASTEFESLEVYSMKFNENVSSNNKYNWISSWY